MFRNNEISNDLQGTWLHDNISLWHRFFSSKITFVENQKIENDLVEGHFRRKFFSSKFFSSKIFFVEKIICRDEFNERVYKILIFLLQASNKFGNCKCFENIIKFNLEVGEVISIK